MPFYDFECKKCKCVYEEQASYDETGKYKGIKCPECNSSSKVKLISGVSYNFTNPEGTDRWNSDSKGHDYRYKHGAKSVAAERKAAEAASHMGKRPYNRIDDISCGKHFGEVK